MDARIIRRVGAEHDIRHGQRRLGFPAFEQVIQQGEIGLIFARTASGCADDLIRGKFIAVSPPHLERRVTTQPDPQPGQQGGGRRHCPLDFMPRDNDRRRGRIGQVAVPQHAQTHQRDKSGRHGFHDDVQGPVQHCKAERQETRRFQRIDCLMPEIFPDHDCKRAEQQNAPQKQSGDSP